MATLGRRGYAPSAETLNRIDTFANWEPGSALAVLRGGQPTPRGVPLSPHRAVVPLNAAFDLLMQTKARLQRQDQAVEQLLADVDRVMSQIAVVISDLEDPRHYPADPGDKPDT
jgi:ABC-type nitrate/sulfonate/bicarbonate transport system substrate-binding protein